MSFRGALFLSPAFSCPASPQSWHSSWLLLDGIQTVPSLPTWAYGEPSASKALSFIPPPSSLREASLMPTGKVPPPLYLPLVFDHPQGFCTYVAASSPHMLPVGTSKGQGQEQARASRSSADLNISPASTPSGFVTLCTSVSFPSLGLSLLICKMNKFTFEDCLVH